MHRWGVIPGLGGVAQQRLVPGLGRGAGGDPLPYSTHKPLPLHNTRRGMLEDVVVTTWGAHPGHPLEDIQSGRGVVHNALLFDKPQKTVVRGPFRMPIKPPWFVTNKKTHILGPRLSAFERKPGFWKFLKIAVGSLGG